MSAQFQIPGYEILEKIASGSTATVWRARQESLDREVAIKVLHPELWAKIGEADAFLAEAQSVAQLRSRHIIQVYDTGHIDGTAYIVLEYVAGETLAEHLKSHPKMSPREAMQIVAAIADALSDAWQCAKMVHRDIKPDNIIIEHDGSVKLADLGLARRIDRETEEDGAMLIVGTPHYMSPEQINGTQPLTPASDMYSLGVTLYQMLTGKIPFFGRPIEDILEAQVSGQLPWPQDIDPHIPLSYCQFVARLMMKDPKNRFPDWNVVYHDASKLAEGRMLMVKLPQGAKSTVASAGKAVTGQKKAIKIKRTQPVSQGSTSHRSKAKLPAMLTSTLRIARAALLLAMIWLFILSPVLNSIDRPHHFPAETSEPQMQDTQRPETAAPIGVSRPQEPQDDGYDDDDDDGGITSAEPTATAVQTPSQAPALNVSQQTKNELLDLLIRHNYDEALTFWRNRADQIDSSLRRDLISEFMRAENMPNVLLTDAMNRYIGRQLTIQMGDQSVTVEVENVNGDVFAGMVPTRSGSATIMRPFQFQISLLPYSDQMQLLRQTTNPYAPYAEVLTALQGNDFATALERAGRMGPLEETVRSFAQSRIDKLVQQ